MPRGREPIVAGAAQADPAIDQALELTGNFSNMVGSSETFAVV
jgi:hypothetical protein